jgi:lactoylglutathione lyase
VQVAIGTNDVYKSAEAVELATKELGGKILRQPGPLPGINTKIASFVDPDGWKVVCFHLFCTVKLLNFRVK